MRGNLRIAAIEFIMTTSGVLYGAILELRVFLGAIPMSVAPAPAASRTETSRADLPSFHFPALSARGNPRHYSSETRVFPEEP
jgi:hypothetical protein